MSFDLGSPQMISGLIGFGGVVVGATISWIVQATLLGRRIEADERLANRKFEFDKDLGERKFLFDKTLAEQKRLDERANVVHRRRFDLAESLLSDAYRFRDLMAFVRNGAAFGAEGESRKGTESEAEDVKHSKDVYFVPIERLRKENDFISALMAKQYAARAHFGTDASTAFSLFTQSLRKVQIAAEMLISLTGKGNYDQKILEDLRKDIWAPVASIQPGGDQLKKQIEEAVQIIERFCAPVLTWKGD
jgi:hypothetical protein